MFRIVRKSTLDEYERRVDNFRDLWSRQITVVLEVQAERNAARRDLALWKDQVARLYEAYSSADRLAHGFNAKISELQAEIARLKSWV